MKAIQIKRTGGPEVLEYVDVPQPEPAPGELIVQTSAIGLNFIDVYHRIGLYPQQLPFIPGSELAGVVAAVGPNVIEFKAGDVVATASAISAYAEYARVPADKAVRVPPFIGVENAAALMLQGMTAHYLTSTTKPLLPGMYCLVQAAAGGVGLQLCQIAKLKGAHVIGTVSTEAKAELARAAGADEIIFYTREEIVPAVKKWTDGRGVDVVYDSVGKSTFEASLASLMPRGMLVSFGQSSGAVPPIDPLRLSRGGSLFLTRPTLAHYIATRDELVQRANDLFTWIGRDRLNVHIDRVVPLASAADAQRALESRATSGKVLLKASG
jgi:NADPH2:quinone reductase